MKKIIIGLLSICALSACDPNNGPGSGVIPSNKDTTMLNMAYGTDAKQKMDIYLPKNRTSANTKVIVLVHGGAWKEGDKADMNNLIPKLKSKWPEAAIANINYRLANGKSILHQQITKDIDDAINFLSSKSQNYSISNNMAMIGASAGGHLSLLYAYKYDTNNRIKAVVNIFGVSYFADWDFYNSVNGFLGGNVSNVYINYVGQAWNTSLYQSLSPYHIVTANNYKPTITFHGDADVIVPVYQSQFFKAKLDSLGLYNVYHQYSGQNHGFSDSYYNDMINKTVPFLKSNM